jgi:type VI secretion system protein ImpB
MASIAAFKNTHIRQCHHRTNPVLPGVSLAHASRGTRQPWQSRRRRWHRRQIHGNPAPQRIAPSDDRYTDVPLSRGKPAPCRAELVAPFNTGRAFTGRHRMAKQSSQKFIARNRAPRVQIEYDVEVYGAQKKVQVPFVMGVMSDLSGANAGELPSVEERKALEIDVDNFDSRLQSMKPRVTFAVPNTLTGEGNLAVDITFESMDDFSPTAVARKVGAVAKLLEARTQLANLDTYMDGKAGAENLIAQALKDPALLQSLVSAPKPADNNKDGE